jgi:hypothetical protein
MVESQCLSQRLNLKQILILLVTGLVLIASTSTARAEILFEGYSKVLLGGTHVGYVVQRYEFDSKKKEFRTTYFVRTNPTGGDITESLSARANANLTPISYQYTSLGKSGPKTLDATFTNGTMTVITKEGGKQSSAVTKIPKGAILSIFLNYLVLQGKEGMKVGVKYNFQAIAEEDGKLYNGEVYIKGEEPASGVKAYKVLTTFKAGTPDAAHYIRHTTAKGEDIDSLEPVAQVATVLAPNVQEATAGLTLAAKNIEMLFGGIPKGNENAIARLAALGKIPSATASAADKKADKTNAIKAGQGVETKAAPSADSTAPADTGASPTAGAGGAKAADAAPPAASEAPKQ